MLADLKELEKHMHVLIDEMSQIRNHTVSPLEAKTKNYNTALIGIPKVIMLVRICPYLEWGEVSNLASVCVALRRTVFGPIGFRILSYTHALYPLSIREVNSYIIPQGPLIIEQPDYEDLAFLRKERARNKQALFFYYDKYKQKKEHYEETILKVKSERGRVFLLKEQLAYFMLRRNQCAKEDAAFRDIIKDASSGFNQKLLSLDNQCEELEKQRKKLQNQKEALVAKVRQYQNQIQSIKMQAQKPKQILKRVKDYLLYKEL